MRRALLDELPQWSQVYPGFLPEHIDGMTYREVRAYRRNFRKVLASQPVNVEEGV